MADDAKLARGAYYQLITRGVCERLENDDGHLLEDRLEPSEAAGHLRQAIEDALSALPCRERQAKQLALTIRWGRNWRRRTGWTP